MSTTDSTALPERIKIAQICRLTGESVRVAQQMCETGEIPTAAKIRGTWSADLVAVKQLVQERKDQACRDRQAALESRPSKTPNGAAMSSTPASVSAAASRPSAGRSSSVTRYETAMSKALGREWRRASNG